MATLTDDVTRLQNDVASFAAFKTQVEHYIQQNQSPAVDTTALEEALSSLESSLSTASGEVSAAENPTPAPTAPAAPSAPSSGSNTGTATS